MFVMGSPRLNANVYRHHTHADRECMALLAPASLALRQSRPLLLS